MAKRKPEVNFYCNICGVRASEPILCVKPGCPTELLVYPLAASVPTGIASEHHALPGPCSRSGLAEAT